MHFMLLFKGGHDFTVLGMVSLYTLRGFLLRTCVSQLLEKVPQLTACVQCANYLQMLTCTYEDLRMQDEDLDA